MNEHRESKEFERGYAQNKIIYELAWRIKTIETEMGEFINKDIQEAPWPEDHNQNINHGMQTALDNLNHF